MTKPGRHVLLLIAAALIILNPAISYAQESEATVDEQRRTGFVYMPIIFSTPETGFALGSAVSIFFRDPDAETESRPSTITPVFIYTKKKQIITQLAADMYWQNEKYRLIANFGFLKYPDKFWGIGNNLPEANEEDFTSRKWSLLLDFQRRLSRNLNAGVQFEMGHSRIIETETGGLLQTAGITGAEGYEVRGAGLGLNWDTRDNVFSAQRGLWYQLSARFYGSGLGSEFSYSRYNLDLRQYLPIGPDQVLACQAYGLFMTGNPPFEMISRLGGPNMLRGYYQGRYSDRNMIALQAEYRRHLRGRLGMVAFAGLGDVAHEASDFRPGDFKYAFGLGIRIQFDPEERINLRLDSAWGRNTSGFYINLMEAF